VNQAAVLHLKVQCRDGGRKGSVNRPCVHASE
jgi:hypothetical protein